jgi:hypothetical protein
MDMGMAMLDGHGHAAWTVNMHHGHLKSCSMAVDMQLGRGHAAWM